MRADKNTTHARRSMARRVTLAGVAFAALAVSHHSAWAASPTGIVAGTIQASIQNSETGGYSGDSAWSAVSKAGTHYGAFQQGSQALKAIHYMNDDGSWNAANSGTASLQDYLNCSACQMKGEDAYLEDNWRQLQSQGTVSTYLGQTGSDGNVYNESALLECSNYFGPAGCRSYISGSYKTGTSLTDQGVASAVAANPHIAADIAKASATDSSAITKGNTLVDNSSRANGGTVSAATAAAQMMTYCSKEVQELMNAAGAQEIDRQTALAGSKQFGYTLQDGNGIGDDASTTTGGKGFSGLSSLGYAAKTCLSNILSGVGGISAMFTLPSLDSLMSQAINAACSMAQSSLSQTMQPLYSKISSLNSMSYVGGGGFMPGMQLFSASAGSGGGSLLSFTGTDGTTTSTGNFQSLLNNDSSWYMSSSGTSGQIYDYNSAASSSLGSAVMDLIH